MLILSGIVLQDFGALVSGCVPVHFILFAVVQGCPGFFLCSVKIKEQLLHLERAPVSSAMRKLSRRDNAGEKGSNLNVDINLNHLSEIDIHMREKMYLKFYFHMFSDRNKAFYRYKCP